MRDKITDTERDAERDAERDTERDAGRGKVKKKRRVSRQVRDAPSPNGEKLLDFDFCAGSFELFGNLVCLFLGDAFLDCLRSGLDEVLCK